MDHLPDLSTLYWFIATTAIFFCIVLGRYLLIAGIFHAIFYLWFPLRWWQRKINSRTYKQEQFKREILWSMFTSFIFSVSGTFTCLLWQKGYMKIYLDTHSYPLWWLPASLLMSLILHETYYYWLHRWMHIPRIFRKIHKVHHDSNVTSAWTAFSFHPIEGIFQAAFLPMLLLIVPMHIYVIILQLTLMTFSSVINHLDIEIYPANFNKHLVGRWIIGATHHSLHHKQFKYNYGLYFTFWDKLKNTESPQFDPLFEAKTGKNKNDV